MEYTLGFFIMCGIDGDVDFKHRETIRIDADDDVQAIEKGNEHLKSRRSGSSLPYAPKLTQGKRVIAWGDPTNPPTAHHLAHVTRP